MRLPVYGEPQPIWDDIPEAIQEQIQEYVIVSTALGYQIVIGWDSAASVAGTTVRCLKRAVEKGMLPKFRTADRGPRGCQVCWPLSYLWTYRQWREQPRLSAPGGRQ